MTIDFGFLPQTVFVYFMLFSRVGAIVMVLPGIGDRSVPIRVRLVFALAISLVFYSILKANIPALPSNMLNMLRVLIFEIIIGLGLGFSVRIIITGLQAAGELIAVQTGLAFAQNVDPSQGIQGTLVSNFLSLLAVVLVFSANLHHVVLQTLHDSYTLFPVGQVFPSGDFAQSAIQTLSNAFRIALQLASPFLVFGLIFYLGVGILSRLIPQVQIFFVAMPANIFLGFLLFMFLLSSLMIVYLDYFGDSLKPYLL